MNEPLTIRLVVDSPQQGWQLLKVVKQFGGPEELERLLAYIGDTIPREVAEERIEDLDLPIRIYVLLKRAGVNNVGELIGSSPEMLRGHGLSTQEIQQVRKALRARHHIGLARNKRQ